MSTSARGADFEHAGLAEMIAQQLESSRARGSSTSPRRRCDISREGRSPTLVTSISLASGMRVTMAQPNKRLDLFGIGERGAQADGNVVGEVIAANGHHAGMRHRAVVEHGNVGGTGADVGHADAEFALVGAEDGIGAGERFEDGVVHVDAGAVQRRHHVLGCGGGGGDDVDA